jgi:soluble lytic murein transglycosylase-like protein
MRLALLAASILLLYPNCLPSPVRELPQPVVAGESRTALTEIYIEIFEGETQAALARALAQQSQLPLEEALEIVELASRESSRHDIDIFTTLSIILVESHARKEAISEVGARGLMQIMPPTGQEIALARKELWEGRESLHDIELNINYGVWYYRQLLETFDHDPQVALTAYNWGPRKVSYQLKRGRALPLDYALAVDRARSAIREEFYYESHGLVRRSYGRASYLFRTRRDGRQS